MIAPVGAPPRFPMRHYVLVNNRGYSKQLKTLEDPSARKRIREDAYQYDVGDGYSRFFVDAEKNLVKTLMNFGWEFDIWGISLDDDSWLKYEEV